MTGATICVPTFPVARWVCCGSPRPFSGQPFSIHRTRQHPIQTAVEILKLNFQPTSQQITQDAPEKIAHAIRPLITAVKIPATISTLFSLFMLFSFLELTHCRTGCPMRNIPNASKNTAALAQVAGNNHARSGHDFILVAGRPLERRVRTGIARHFLSVRGDDPDNRPTAATTLPDIHSLCLSFFLRCFSFRASAASSSSRAFCSASI